METMVKFNNLLVVLSSISFGIMASEGHSSTAVYDPSLSEYSEKHYNVLPSPEVAQERLQSTPAFKEFLVEGFQLIEERDLPIGFRLLHKHFEVPTGYAMVESFVEDFLPLNSPALVTSCRHVLPEASPASWIVKPDGSYLVFEFSIDEKVTQLIHWLRGNPGVLYDLSTLILKYNLEESIAPAIMCRSSQAFFQCAKLLEQQYSKYGSVVTNQLNIPSNQNSVRIQTSWGSKQVVCIPDTECDYDPGLEQHFIVKSVHNEY